MSVPFVRDKRTERRLRRKRRTLHAIAPRGQRYRLTFERSNYFLHSQLIDYTTNRTICSVSTNSDDFPEKSKKNKEAARKLGEFIAQKAIKEGIRDVVLDRRGYLYHGRTQEFSEAARSQGLKF